MNTTKDEYDACPYCETTQMGAVELTSTTVFLVCTNKIYEFGDPELEALLQEERINLMYPTPRARVSNYFRCKVCGSEWSHRI